MKIIIDLDELIGLDITIEQYYFLSLLYFNRLDLLIQYTNKYGEFSIQDIETLKQKAFINYSEFKGDITALKVTDKGKAFMHSLEVVNHEEEMSLNEEQFDELCVSYPKKSNSGRQLQSGLKVNKIRWMKSYFKNLKVTKNTHQQVIQAVNNEIQHRRLSNSSEYFCMLSTYINGGKWDAYLGESKQIVQSGHLKAI